MVVVVGDMWDSESGRVWPCGETGSHDGGRGWGEPDCELGGAGLAVLMTLPLTHHTVGPCQQNLWELSHFAWSWAREKRVQKTVSERIIVSKPTLLGLEGCLRVGTEAQGSRDPR